MERFEFEDNHVDMSESQSLFLEQMKTTIIRNNNIKTVLSHPFAEAGYEKLTGTNKCNNDNANDDLPEDSIKDINFSGNMYKDSFLFATKR